MADKMDPSAAVDQMLAMYRDILGQAPVLLRSFYLSCIKEGFTEQQSLQLTVRALSNMLFRNGE